MTNLINTAISGLKLSQLALSVTGQNIVNANTEGYTRQSVLAQTGPTLFNGVGYVGSGVTVDQIARNTEQFLIDQYSKDLSILGEFEQYLGNISQVDSLLADPSTSVAASIDDFFAAVNAVANNPSAIETRQLLLTQTNLMLDRLDSADARLSSQANSLNSQLSSSARAVTTLGKEIAELNLAIVGAQGTSRGSQPNDLLDRRDSLIRDLSDLVDVRTTVGSDLSMNVFIGEGQGLVIGMTSAFLVAVPNTLDPGVVDLAFLDKNELQVVTGQMTGGQIGGALRFREEVLNPAGNGLGRIVLAVTDSMNRQQQLGVDLEGNLGKSIFADINNSQFSQSRVKTDANNPAPADRLLSVRIDDLSKLSTSDYRVTFPGPGNQFSIVRVDDNSVVKQDVIGSKLPVEVSVDGFTLQFLAGSFQSGDNFLIQPTRTAIEHTSIQINRPEEFALASPLISDSSLSNQGGAFVAGMSVSDVSTPSFDIHNGSLNPPILIRFTSQTTYDVLDATDPSRPVPLQPPLTNRAFVPGANNSVFPNDPQGTTLVSPVGNVATPQIDTLANGYRNETLTITSTDPSSGYTKETRLQIAANTSAQVIAGQMSAVEGVFATAYSQLYLSDFRSDSLGAGLSLELNGINLTLASTDSAVSIPSPLTADFVRDRINASTKLKGQGIIASSDGNGVTVRSSTGVDLAVEVGGTGGDSVVLRGGDLQSVIGRQNLSSGYTAAFNTRFEIDLGFGAVSVPLSPGTIAGSNVVSTLQADVDRALGANTVTVGRSPDGRLLLEPVDKSKVLAIKSIVGADILGIEPMTLSGPDRGEQPASVGPGVSAVNPLNFAVTSGSFDVTVNGIFSDTFTLSDSYPFEGGSAIVQALNAQFASSTAASGVAGLVQARLSDSGGIEIVTTNVGPDARLSISAVTDMQGLISPTAAKGFVLSGTQATLVGNASVNAGANFEVDGPHQFEISVDGMGPVTVSLTGSTRSSATFINSLDISAGVDLTAIPNSFQLGVTGYADAVIDVSGIDTSLAASPYDSAPQGLVNLFQERIDLALGAGVVSVGLNGAGNVTLTTIDEGAGTSLTVFGPTGDVATSIFPVVGTAVGAETGSAGVVSLVQNALDSSLLAAGLNPVTVAVDSNGLLSFSSTSYGESSEIQLSSVSKTYGFVLPGIDTGEQFKTTATVGGMLEVQFSEGTRLSSNRLAGVFGAQPQAIKNYTGYQVSLSSGQSGGGLPKAGDSFVIDYNSQGSNDNSNALAMLALSDKNLLSNGNFGITSAYAQIVQEIGILTSQARTSATASESLMRQSQAALSSLAGVNIDEEAGNLIKYEQSYNASAQLISIARDLFDAILQI
jgi:flagellar hook-associated protein 1 FlgK